MLQLRHLGSSVGTKIIEAITAIVPRPLVVAIQKFCLVAKKARIGAAVVAIVLTSDSFIARVVRSELLIVATVVAAVQTVFAVG